MRNCQVRAASVPAHYNGRKGEQPVRSRVMGWIFLAWVSFVPVFGDSGASPLFNKKSDDPLRQTGRTAQDPSWFDESIRSRRAEDVERAIQKAAFKHAMTPEEMNDMRTRYTQGWTNLFVSWSDEDRGAYLGLEAEVVSPFEAPAKDVEIFEGPGAVADTVLVWVSLGAACAMGLFIFVGREILRVRREDREGIGPS